MQQEFRIAPSQETVQSTKPPRRLRLELHLLGRRWLGCAAVSSCLIVGVASAQTAVPVNQQPVPPGQISPAPQQPAIAPVTESITVHADNQLLEPEATGSRLGLTPLETPAQIFSITPDTIERRGYTQIEEAVDSLPGVTSGGSPADPSQFVVRGFVGNYVSLLRDGIYVGPANMVTRAENAFNLRSIDLLSGPSSVLYGQGAVGGTVNVITKRPIFTPLSIDAYSEVSSFSTFEEGFGVGGQISHSLAFRSDFSYYQSHGYVINANPKNLNGTGSLLYAPTKTLSFLVALDVLKDNLSSYYGTPLVATAFAASPLTGVISNNLGLALDSRMRFKNYNTLDSIHNSSSYQPSLTMTWQLTSHLTITDQAYYYHAARNWRNAETYVFIPAGTQDGDGAIAPVNLIARDRFHVYHNQQLPGDSFNALYDHRLFGFSNKFSLGYEFYHVSFLRSRGFPNANYADYVDPLNPVQGIYAAPATGLNAGDSGDFPSRIAPTKVTDNAVYAEDSLRINSKLNVVTGIHFENFYLDRLNFTQGGAPQTALDFNGTYHPFDLRVGAVYDLYKGLTAYGQFTTAKTPPGSNIFLVNALAGAPFQLSGAKEGEVGLKQNFPRSFGEMTLAFYDINVNNILTVTQNSVSSDNGQQRSKGIEFSTILHPVRAVDVNFNTAYTYARYGYFFDPNTGDNNTGLTPADVPATTTNLWVDTRRIGTLPLEVGAGLRFVGARYANNQNNITLNNYATFDVYATYHLKEKFDFSARGKNLTNKAYASFADINYPSEIILAAPRSYMVSMTGHF